MRVPLVTIVGVGLIGGSIGLAAKMRGAALRVRGVGRDAGRLEQGRRLGAIDEACLDLATGVRDADLVIFCTPVDRIAAQVIEAAPYCKPGAILTDAGSTKEQIVRAVESASLPDGVQFIGGHPIAGSEKTGVEHARADLFVGRTVILTPTAVTPNDVTARLSTFWRALGGITATLSPGQHDQALALTSHLPHLVASALAGLLPGDWRNFAASGFRDTTRVAAGDPDLWAPIFQHNQDAVAQALKLLEDRLAEFREALAKNDRVRIKEFLSQGKRVRDALGS